jgi:hypothetical protein
MQRKKWLEKSKESQKTVKRAHVVEEIKDMIQHQYCQSCGKTSIKLKLLIIETTYVDEKGSIEKYLQSLPQYYWVCNTCADNKENLLFKEVFKI